MGLIKAALGAASGVLGDQWKEYFYCDALPADVIAVQGEKRRSGRSSNRRGGDNIITDGSVLAVANGQCALIVEQGKVVELCAEPGEYTYQTGTQPSLLSGSLPKNGIEDVFAELGQRFTFGGQAAADQRIYYFNTKELVGNKYGTPQPCPLPGGGPASRHRHGHRHPLLWRVQLPGGKPHLVLYQCMRQHLGAVYTGRH